METKPEMEPSRSSVPGVIPEPIRVHHDSGPSHEGRGAAPKPSATAEPASSPRRRNPASVLLAKLLSAVRGYKYMTDAYPPARRRPSAVRVEDKGVEARPDTGGQAAPAGSQTKEG
jgi:hypothetical protein